MENLICYSRVLFDTRVRFKAVLAFSLVEIRVLEVIFK